MHWAFFAPGTQIEELTAYFTCMSDQANTRLRALKARVTLRGPCTCALPVQSQLPHLGRLFTQQHSPTITGSHPLGQALDYRKKEGLHLLLSQTQSSRDLASTLKALPCARGCSCISYILTHKILPTSLQVDNIIHTIITFISQMRKLKHRVVQ